MGSFRESPRGSQNLVASGAGGSVSKPVFDDSYTLLALFGSPVPHRCPGPLGTPTGPPRELQGGPKGPPRGLQRTLIWC